jgi:hypothetical protein
MLAIAGSSGLTGRIMADSTWSGMYFASFFERTEFGSGLVRSSPLPFSPSAPYPASSDTVSRLLGSLDFAINICG